MAHAWYYFEFCARDRLCGVLAGRERDERVVRPVDNKCRPLDRAELFDTRTIAQNCKHLPANSLRVIRAIDGGFHARTQDILWDRVPETSDDPIDIMCWMIFSRSDASGRARNPPRRLLPR